MTVGVSPKQGDLWKSSVEFCSSRVGEDSIYAVLHRECFDLFPDEMFEDLFTDRGRRSVPPMIMAVAMVLQRVEGLSDREAAQRFAFDLRWKYAAGGLDVDYPGFDHTVFVNTRARLAGSDDPDRIFNATLEAAKAAGLVGRKRVLDSTPLYDAVATMDTVTLIRSAIRGVLKAAGSELAQELGGLLQRADDYVDAGKPSCDWDDAVARKVLVDELAKDAMRLLTALEGRSLDPVLGQGVELLATVVGQDLETDEHGVFGIVRKVAKNRTISTVDPQARHGHKTSARGFDGYKGHIAIDPDSELITATTATAGNAGDAGPVDDLLAQDLATDTADLDADTKVDDTVDSQDSQDSQDGAAEVAAEADGSGADDLVDVDTGTCGHGVSEGEDGEGGRVDEGGSQDSKNRLRVYGDAAYGSGETLAGFEANDVENFTKVQPPSAKAGLFTKDQFDIDQPTGQVRCPNGQVAPIHPGKNGGGTAKFGQVCGECPLAQMCTKSARGRTIRFGPHEDELTRARRRQQDPAWQEEYRATRPKVERKIGHLMRRKHGGRYARMRGLQKVGADLKLLAAATNLARLGKLGYSSGMNQNTYLAPA